MWVENLRRFDYGQFVERDWELGSIALDHGDSLVTDGESACCQPNALEQLRKPLINRTRRPLTQRRNADARWSDIVRVRCDEHGAVDVASGEGS